LGVDVSLEGAFTGSAFGAGEEPPPLPAESPLEDWPLEGSLAPPPVGALWVAGLVVALPAVVVALPAVEPASLVSLPAELAAESTAVPTEPVGRGAPFAGATAIDQQTTAIATAIPSERVIDVRLPLPGN
jgi:hypothetical protein